MKHVKKIKELKYFFVSVIISSIFLLSIVCFIIAERNISCIILGSENRFIEINDKIMQISFLDKIVSIDFEKILEEFDFSLNI